MIFKDYYKILGLENSKVSLDEIKIAYRESAKKYHPDLNNGEEISEDRFKDISEAYRILSNSSSKRKYDRSWYYYVGRKQKAYNSSKKNKTVKRKDFFNIFFGNNEETEEKNDDMPNEKRIPTRGENIETEIDASIVDGYFGKEKNITLKNIEGKDRTLKVKIPEGIRNEEKIRLIGQGKPGISGGKNGDLIIKINLKNTEKFSVNGINLNTTLDISPWEAALGTKIVLQGIDEDVTVDIPKGINSDEKLVIKNRGYKDNNGKRGDLIIRIRIVLPKQLSKEEEDLLHKLSKISRYNPRTG